VIYNFTVDEVVIRVCKKFFLKTLGIGEKTVRVVVRNSSVKSTGIDLHGDMRGKHPKKHALSAEQIQSVKDHIGSFPVVDSHYCRKTSMRQYLEHSLTISKMYDLYCQQKWNTVPVKKTSYVKIFNSEFNIGFYKPRKDQCDECDIFEKMTEDDRLKNTGKHQRHLRRKEQSRRHKEVDKTAAKCNSHVKTATFDMQKVLVTPSLMISRAYYLRKLSTYNLTVFDLATADVTCYMWDESQGSKGSSESATCLQKWLTALPSDVTHVILYSDTAAGQNRNQSVLMMYMQVVSFSNITVIEHKFMESGHSQMEVDSVHARIEQKCRNVPIYTPDGWYTLVRSSCKKPYNVVELQFNDWKAWKYLAQTELRNTKKADDGTTLNWLKLKWIKVTKYDQEAFYVKEELDNEIPFKRVSIKKAPRKSHRTTVIVDRVATELDNDVKVIPLPSQLYHSRLPISKAKIADLQQLVASGAIQQNYRSFYDNLNENLDNLVENE